jgi:peptidoglycan/LPS O-acetylase OafA/YrhL
MASLACAVGLLLANGTFPAYRLFAHLLFLNGVLPDAANLAPPFWSLATEWQFYVILPLLCYGAYRFSFWGAALATAFACVLFRCWAYLVSPELAENLQGQLPFRLVEFVWGMGVAYLFSKNIPLPRFLKGNAGFLVGLGIAYLGRILRVTEMVQFAHTYGPMAKALAEPVMSLGFAIILWNVIGSNSLMSRTLCLKPVTLVGRWSYSLYLWHWYPCLWIGGNFRKFFGSTPGFQHFAFFVSLLILLPLSWGSFRLLEQFYFRKKHHS